MNSRLCIYVTYDKDETVDKYIGYILKELKICCDYLAVVCNTKQIKKGREYLEVYSDKIFFRNNNGYDAGAFKDALCNLLGWNKVLAYDELVLANDSFFGPFKSMQSVFEDMEKETVDFWGLTKHAAVKKENEILKEHIQSYFLTIRSRMLHSDMFIRYWEDMPYYQNFNDVVQKHEVYFTDYFTRLGYRWGCLADMAPNDSEHSENNYMQYGYLQYELIAKRNFPFLKKKPIMLNTLDMQTQENLKQALEYIDCNTKYDVDMIWENIIRTMDISDLQRSFHLEYIIQKKSGGVRKPYSSAVVIFAEHNEATEYVMEYADRIQSDTYVEIYTHNAEIALKCRKKGYHCIEMEAAQTMENILVKYLKYQYICILHDCDCTSSREPSCTGKSFLYNAWHNLIADKNYIDNVLCLFDSDKRLGALVPQAPNFAGYFGKAASVWESHYTDMENFVKENNILCRMSKDKRPYTISESLWIRNDLLKRVIECRLFEKDFLPLAWTYIAQSIGCYVGVVESDEYASINEINQQNYINQIIDQVKRQYGEVNTFLDLQKHIFRGKMMEFCHKYRKIYIYGTGKKAKQYKNVIPDITGYIVSDGQLRENKMDNKDVLYLSEFADGEDAGIIVCLDEKNQGQVIPLLEERKLHYLCI